MVKVELQVIFNEIDALFLQSNQKVTIDCHQFTNFEIQGVSVTILRAKRVNQMKLYCQFGLIEENMRRSH